MGGSADPETPTPSPPSAEVKRLKRCVQSKLSWGPVKPCGGGDGGAAGSTAAAEEGAEKEKAVAEKGTKRGRGNGKLRKSEAGKKSPSNKETTGLDPSSKDEVILVEGSPQKKQRKGGSQAVALKAPNRKRCKAMGSVDGHGSCQQLHNSQTEAVVPEASPVSIDIDLMSIHSESRQVNGKAGVLEDQGQCEFLFDPRSEAKIAEEENLKLLSGKKIHPFFTSRVVNKGAGRDVINIDDRHSFCAFDRDLPYCPIHVLYQSEANVPIDWSKWVINKGSFLDTDTSDPLESAFSLFEGLVKPLTIETHCKRKHLDQLAEVNFTEHATAGMDLQIFSKEQSESKFSLDVIHVDDENMLASNSSCCVSLDNKHQEMVVNGRPEIFQKGCQPGCYLWTDKYRPETASQVCGNCEHVNFLNDWLKAWDERGHKNKHIGIANGNRNGSLCHDESDVDYSDDASDYENVLLITGPVGCGKSAAVFACAKEQGFNVIEVNTSDMRNGAYVRQKFEEATKSHGLEKWSQEEVMSPPREDLLVLSLGTSDSTDNKHSPSCSTRIAISCDQHKSPAKDYLGSKGSHELPKLAINKTLILFEDVDTVFDEDRGFISTILKLAETTKWPIILTSNKKDPALPRLLDQLVLDFKYPSSAELLSHVEMICKTEGADITVPIMKHIIYTCSGDIRKTIMLLQFWCQGGREYTDRLNKCSSGPFSVDLEAVHSAVPKMLPWEFQCQLSETVCKEIDQTIFLAEQNKRQMNALRLEDLKSQVMISSLTKGRSTTKTRKTKKSKLKRGHSTNCKEISPCDNDLDDFNDAPDVPVPSDLQRIRNRHGAVLSSESDDDPTGDCTPKDTRFTSPESGIFPTSSGMPDLNELETLSCFPVPSESRDTFGIVNSFENPSGSNMAESPSRICDTFMSQDVSYVPESAFIVESISVSNADFLSLAISNDLSLFCDDRIHAPFTTVENTNNMENVMTARHKYMEDVVGETCEVDLESFCRNEQASCSTTGYQLMDECSRAESIWLLSGKQSKDSCKSECVQDTWDRLRSRRLELLRGTNHQRTSSGALKLASGISDLISESDILFTRCNPLTVDILDPSSTPCVEPDEFSWYDRQLEMGSVYARHALCFYSKNCQDMGENSVDIAHELLSASSTATSLGKVLNLSIDVNYGSRNSLHVRRERQSHVYEVLLPIIPAKLSLSLSGPAFIDYLSSTSQISRLEYSRISESKAINMQRRSRESRHYLSSGALSLSPEDVELLAESSCFNNRT